MRFGTKKKEVYQNEKMDPFGDCRSAGLHLPVARHGLCRRQHRHCTEGGYIAADPTEDDVILTQEDLLILDAAEDYGTTATGARTSGLITSAR